MGRRGPPRQPLKVLAHKGSNRAKGRPEDKLREIKEVEGEPEMPDGLSAAEKKCWNELLGWISDMEISSPSDAHNMIDYCQTLARYNRNLKIVEKEGWIVKTQRGGGKVNPLAKLLDVWHKDLIRLRREFGMSPAARAGLGAPVKTKLPDKSVERFFQNKRAG